MKPTPTTQFIYPEIAAVIKAKDEAMATFKEVEQDYKTSKERLDLIEQCLVELNQNIDHAQFEHREKANRLQLFSYWAFGILGAVVVGLIGWIILR